MRGKDFDAVALSRIRRAVKEGDREILCGYLAENYSQTVRLEACRALADLGGEPVIKKEREQPFKRSSVEDEDPQNSRNFRGCPRLDLVPVYSGSSSICHEKTTVF